MTISALSELDTSTAPAVCQTCKDSRPCQTIGYHHTDPIITFPLAGNTSYDPSGAYAVCPDCKRVIMMRSFGSR